MTKIRLWQMLRSEATSFTSSLSGLSGTADQLKEGNGRGSSSGFIPLDVSELGCIPGLLVLGRSDTDSPTVNCTRNTVLGLDVDLWHVEVSLIVGIVFLDISS